MDRFSFLGAVNGAFVEDLYQTYLVNPDGIDKNWKVFFQGYDFANEDYSDKKIPDYVQKEFDVIKLIDAYASRGHLFTKTNPVRERRKYTPDLSIEHYNLSDLDLDTEFEAGNIIGIGKALLKDIIYRLKEIYCKSTGFEYMYIRKPERLKWIRDKIHNSVNVVFSEEKKKSILNKLNQAVAFEDFLHTKYVGQKRFSLEGGESLIPALDALVEKASSLGVKEFVMGMAHRGRLNVLANIFGKTYDAIFSEFEGKDFEETDELFDGDVKYHLGWSCKAHTDKGKEIRMNLAPNPSHLEAVGPVVEGIVRSKIDRVYRDEGQIMPVIIHGDSAIAGQGVVYETIQMADLDGYKTGGTIHIVVNNQIGFTTNYIDSRSGTYCTDVGKVTLSPVLHVNGDDVEAVVNAIEFAAEYRIQFKKDVFVDLLCYRRYGHNEGDEPRFTQPNLYKAIAKHPNPREIYKKKLIGEGTIGENIVKEMEVEFKKLLQERFDEAKQVEKTIITPFMQEDWKDYEIPKRNQAREAIDTTVPIEDLTSIGDKIFTLPEDKKFLKKIERLFEDRKGMLVKNHLDWGIGELLAYGTLLNEGFNVRLSGQDVERGTFSHRHSIVKVEESEAEINVLNHISDKQGSMWIYNSPLSEYGVMAYDYGYAMASPKTLTIWEAQFGDFSNGAQIMIDQYLSCAEDKWKLQNGLVLLLPHGYEGQGAEHSSARVERYLQLCAQDNMRAVNCSTPASFYHILREQMKQEFRKPLIVFTPKSLLRHPKCISSLEELANGHFKQVINDDTVDKTKVKKVVMCTGKFYYDLLAEREKLGKQDEVVLVRLEQLYPMPTAKIEKILDEYGVDDLVWAQEEPENMGTWSHILRYLRHLSFKVACPPESAASAAGSFNRAMARHRQAIKKVFQ